MALASRPTSSDSRLAQAVMAQRELRVIRIWMVFMMSVSVMFVSNG
jgi:hypothetical protein